ncbi:MAG: hypothetical protein KatS3mg083_362 [Candidatus Dojkabacteria bacterium]|nr:MAG: hypothetical protein KatS3mg083_362 [Candidatus Dojkabacteria bacterium]GIW61893.1 MAG: hypothetical protein KatS3mg089_0745 [Patescibacteria group bacterium]
MNIKSIIIILIVIVFLSSLFLLLTNNATNTPNSGSKNQQAITTPTPTSINPTSEESLPSANKEEVSTKEFTLTASNFRYDVKEIRVRQGDTVKVTLKIAEGFHDFVLDDYNVRTKQLSAGQEDTIEFVAAKKGEFEYYCSIGNHRQMGMVGKLIVE